MLILSIKIFIFADMKKTIPYIRTIPLGVLDIFSHTFLPHFPHGRFVKFSIFLNFTKYAQHPSTSRLASEDRRLCPPILRTAADRKRTHPNTTGSFHRGDRHTHGCAPCCRARDTVTQGLSCRVHHAVCHRAVPR